MSLVALGSHLGGSLLVDVRLLQFGRESPELRTPLDTVVPSMLAAHLADPLAHPVLRKVLLGKHPGRVPHSEIKTVCYEGSIHLLPTWGGG